MNEDSYLLEPKQKKAKTPYEWFMLFLRITFFISAFILVVITVLANMGGSSETWKEGVRSFISEISGGRTVKLDKLNNLTFFPTVSVDVQGAKIYADEDAEIPLISVGNFRLAMPFWNVATRSPLITDFYIQDVSTIKGVFMPAEFEIDKLFIDHDQESEKAVLRVNGKIGLQAWSIQAGLDVQKTLSGKNTYIISPKSPFRFNFADIHIKGVYDHASSRRMKIENIELTSGQQLMSGDITLSSLGDKLIKFTAEFNIGNNRSVIATDLVIDISRKQGALFHISGDINSKKLDIEDISGNKSIWNVISRLRELMGYSIELGDGKENPGLPFSRHDLDLHVFLENVTAPGNSYEALSFDIFQDKANFRISSITGKDEAKLMPAIMILPQSLESKNFVFVMEEGSIDPGFFGSWFKNLPLELSNTKQEQHVRCAIGNFYAKESGWELNQASEFIFSDSANQNPEHIKLPKDQYEFVKAGLQKSAKESPCEPYIFLEEKQENP